MAAINQLPAGAEGVAAFALIYTSISWICSALLIWCAQLHQEAWSYISLLAYFALISNTGSMIQQSHDITYYRDIVTEQFRRKQAFIQNPELAIANGSYGLDLVLYYIQYYCYNVEAMLVMFWAFELAQSVYGLSAKQHLKVLLRRINSTGKVVAVFFPMLTILLLRAPAIQDVFVVFILLADLPLMISLAISSMTMVAILVRYVQSRKQFSNWTPQGNGTAVTNDTSTDTIQTNGTDRSGSTKKLRRRQGLYDRWLMIRFTVAFVVLAMFEVTNTLFQLQSVNNNKKDAASTEPDFSLDRAKSTFFLFLPGVTPGIFLFLVFGTTAGCRAALMGIFKTRSRQSSSNKSARSIWQPRQKSTSNDIERATQDPFADSSEVDTKDGDGVVSPLPAGSLVSKYSTQFGSIQEPITSLTPSHQQRASPAPDKYSAYQMPAAEGLDGVELRSITSLEQVPDEYYRPNSEESDDSGPILPIMSPQERRMSRAQIGMALSSSSKIRRSSLVQ